MPLCRISAQFVSEGSSLLAFLAFLFPLAVYFLILGLINRRRHPLLVPGTWDLVGLLFAASGFLLFGGPRILNTLHERWQISWLLSQRRAAPGAGVEGFSFWLFLSLLYFVAVVGGTAVLLWQRRNQVAIYNIEPAVLDEALELVLDRLGLSWSRSGHQVYVGFAASPANPGRKVEAEVPDEIKPAPFASAGEMAGSAARLELDPSPRLYHVTLRFSDVDPPLRQGIERGLGQVLSQVRTRSNPVGGWLLALAFLLLSLTTGLALLIILVRMMTVG
jgi:hypothetical protein